MSYDQVLDILNKSDNKMSTFPEKSWKHFGPKQKPENEPMLGSLRSISLKDALSKSQMEILNKNKPTLNMTKDDFKKILNGKDASQRFLDDNKKSISKYLSAVMNSEDNMIGYLNFSTEGLNENNKVSIYEPFNHGENPLSSVRAQK